MIAALFTKAAKELAQIARHLNFTEMADGLQTMADEMAVTTMEHGWDGKWFLRAYDHFGQAVGSKSCEEGRIFIEPQGLCAIAGIGVKEGYVHQALKAVEDQLATEHGILLLQPAFRSYHLHLGEISTYPPGFKENASVFCHTNPWVMIAEAILGHGGKALDYYLRINPSRREEISDLHRCEPYVYAQTIAGRDADCFGEAKNSWLTGTAAWNYVAISQWILGIRPEYEGLRVEPVIPLHWKGYKVDRKFRGVEYEIEVIRVGPGNSVSIVVDGESIQGTIIPPAEKDHVQVTVTVA